MRAGYQHDLSKVDSEQIPRLQILPESADLMTACLLPSWEDCIVPAKAEAVHAAVIRTQVGW